MADIKFSEFQKANTSKDSDEIAILQDGVNKMIASPILESKIINKTVSRVIEQGGASLNVINLKGVVPTYADLATITPTPQLNDAYQVEADGLVYVYTESGFQADGDGFLVQSEPTGVVEEGNTNAVSGGEVFNYALSKENFINNSYSDQKNYTFFSITTDNVWYFTPKIKVTKGDSFVWKGFSEEPIGELFDVNNVKVSDLPESDSLSVLKTINYIVPSDGFIHFKSAKWWNDFNSSSLFINKNNIYATNEVYDKEIIGDSGNKGVGTSDPFPFDIVDQQAYFLQKENFETH